MKYSTILWDMDGVLMDSEIQHWRAWERTFTELFGIDRIDWEVYKHTIGVRYEVVAELYERTYGVDIREESVKERYFHHKAEVEREEGYFLTPHIEEVLRELRIRGYRMAVASSSSFSDIERSRTEIFIGTNTLSSCIVSFFFALNKVLASDAVVCPPLTICRSHIFVM